MLLNEEDRGDLPLEIKHESEWVDLWKAARALLDKDHWHRFYPKVVHPEFQQQVWVAVQERFEREGPPTYIEAWRKRCGTSP